MFQDTETWGRRPVLPVAKRGHHVRDGSKQELQTTSGCVCLSHAGSPGQGWLQADALPVQEVLMEPQACVEACSQAVVSETGGLLQPGEWPHAGRELSQEGRVRS